MVMSITHIAYISCLVTNDAWHAYDAIGIYKIHLRAGGSHISRNRQYCGWLVRLWARSVPITFNRASKTVVG